ncbi:MAG: hypothetical protein J2P36_32255, partial [Ktedonobacteraceae bacterium]|nr:hypothetical protein [Ktedonobacteraceae bacterium]
GCAACGGAGEEKMSGAPVLLFRLPTALMRPLDRSSETLLAQLRFASSDGKVFPLRGQPGGEAASP